ncbi:1,6-anhydro-N-acetylmuramyl-L-alanine amidase AmpD [Cardiobacteriaceae bacterium TAE3-ERU3]|nr:1,6-anhydro-N-acetylmuramyl-L-alanine amidase AmpD [Cardiobacteriaceae bacterium TAE3-ERU3]
MKQPLLIDTQGWLLNARHIHSPFQNQRPTSAPINLLVLHNISLPPGVFGATHIDALFAGNIAQHQGEDPFIDSIMDLQVSAHFLITRDGAITQYVSTCDRAWHAGASEYEGQSGCNDFSIGIELNGCDHHPYTHRQYLSLALLTQAIMIRHPQINAERITTHQHIAPQRKTDPGPAFNMRYFKHLIQRLDHL